ncbi:DUF4468 domain-containing protein [Spirosoma sp. SC4-14]|uniref:DUF4468 domain-containing protein n=1 Tax=Spirosoma sp. SC4-14 TaxID=3128900 RepID=UPI0030CD9A87
MNTKLLDVLPIVNQKVTYTDVVDCGSVSQTDLFRRARIELAQSSTSGSELFLVSDKETGDLVSRGKLTLTIPRSESFSGGVFSFRYSIVVECSNRKYRATLTNIGIEDGSAEKLTPIEAYTQRSEKDLQLIYTALDQQLKARLAALQENVKNYKPF